ncbi:hypothetical protein GCM10009841_15490 [Microlunatus panaciterrae]|uniref:DUF559 domain-containing protein n=1 Tax=Microlunatus panaciterrae TaxID=400768 RepID=A0ABS2RNQ3_9ACTN|nr:hypothetical protein [Microlunatus panaciterrae]MBM7800107.1 hypothetical protein [Microlunatus panaciterrae]
MARSRFRTELTTAQLPLSAAELVARGVTRSMRCGPKWRRTSRGFFLPSQLPDTPTQRILAAVPLVPASGAITGWAAAFARGVDDLDGLDPCTMQPLPVLICLGRDVGRGTAAAYCRDRLPDSDVAEVAGIRFTTALRAGMDCARSAPDLAEAVAVVDAMARQRVFGLGLLARYLGRHPGWRGIHQARRACELADPHARNGWESRLRVFYQVDLGLPRPLANAPLFDRRGNLLGIGDLVDPDAGLVLEFDGQDHRGRHRHRADNVREERLEDHHLVVIRVDSLDLRHHRADLKARVLSGRRRGLARDRSRDRWTLRQPDWWLADEPIDEQLTAEELGWLLGDGR